MSKKGPALGLRNLLLSSWLSRNELVDSQRGYHIYIYIIACIYVQTYVFIRYTYVCHIHAYVFVAVYSFTTACCWLLRKGSENGGGHFRWAVFCFLRLPRACLWTIRPGRNVGCTMVFPKFFERTRASSNDVILLASCFRVSRTGPDYGAYSVSSESKQEIRASFCFLAH